MSARAPTDSDPVAPAETLDAEESRAVSKRQSGSARVVHEVIRARGDEELGRSAKALLLSSLAGGLAVSSSLLGVSLLRAGLPDAPWTPLVTSLGYTIGFVVVVLGNLQLFTESTVTAVLPIATHPTPANLARMIRLWALVLAGNLLGTFIVAAMISHAWIVTPEVRDAAAHFSEHLTTRGFWQTVAMGIPAGFLIASLAWVLPNERPNAFWVVVTITYLVALGGFAHVIVGSAEAWLLLFTGRASLAWVVTGFIAPALLGNILGGTGLFAVLAHGQVADEIANDMPAA